MVAIKLVAAVIAGAQIALAASGVPFQTREVYYLANCEQSINTGIIDGSYMIYWSNATQASSDPRAIPDDQAQITSSTWVKWEAVSITGKFSSTAKFTSNINANAQSQAVNALVGTGSGGIDNVKWNCYRDKGNLVAVLDERWCSAVYYCYTQ